jgi:hypothetical protein
VSLDDDSDGVYDRAGTGGGGRVAGVTALSAADEASERTNAAAARVGAGEPAGDAADTPLLCGTGDRTGTLGDARCTIGDAGADVVDLVVTSRMLTTALVVSGGARPLLARTAAGGGRRNATPATAAFTGTRRDAAGNAAVAAVLLLLRGTDAGVPPGVLRADCVECCGGDTNIDGGIDKRADLDAVVRSMPRGDSSVLLSTRAGTGDGSVRADVVRARGCTGGGVASGVGAAARVDAPVERVDGVGGGGRRDNVAALASSPTTTAPNFAIRARNAGVIAAADTRLISRAGGADVGTGGGADRGTAALVVALRTGAVAALGTDRYAVESDLLGGADDGGGGFATGAAFDFKISLNVGVSSDEVEATESDLTVRASSRGPGALLAASGSPRRVDAFLCDKTCCARTDSDPRLIASRSRCSTTSRVANSGSSSVCVTVFDDGSLV